MIDTALFKQTLKDASDDEAKALYGWATVCMEVRGLIPMAGAQPVRKRRSDAFCNLGSAHFGKCNGKKLPHCSDPRPEGAQPTIETVRERLQPSLSGLPDEDQK